MEICNCFILGSITKTHGLHGNVSIAFEAEEFEEYSKVELVFLKIKGKLVPFFISSLSFGTKNTGIAKFDYIDSIDAAKEIVGSKLYLPNQYRSELAEDEYYSSHLIGYTAFDSKTGKTIGIIEDIIEYPSNQLFKIDKNGSEILIPVSDDFVVDLDKKNKMVTLSIPEGLLDIFD